MKKNEILLLIILNLVFVILLLVAFGSERLTKMEGHLKENRATLLEIEKTLNTITEYHYKND